MGLLGKQPGVVATTVVEVLGLVGWVALATEAVTVDPAASGVAAPPVAVGIGVLFVALSVKHVLADATVNGLHRRLVSPSTVVFAATETALWVAWLLVAEAVGGVVGVVVAGAVLAALLVPNHAVEREVLQVGTSAPQRLAYWTLPVSVVEALGATVLLALVVDPALIDAVAAATDPALVATVGSAADQHAPVAVGSDVRPTLAGVGVLAAFLFVERNACVWFALGSTDDEDDDGGPDRLESPTAQ